jgi:hypothetical protein
MRKVPGCALGLPDQPGPELGTTPPRLAAATVGICAEVQALAARHDLVRLLIAAYTESRHPWQQIGSV